MGIDKFEFSEEEAGKISELRQLVEDCKELQIGTEDVLLTKYLYFAKWDVTKAYAAIHDYYDFKAANPEWTSRRPLSELKEVFTAIKPRYLLSNKDKYGRYILVHQMVDGFDKRPDYFHDMVEMDDLIFEALLSTPNGQKYGVSVINDFAGLNRNFMKVMTPTNSKLINKKNEVIPFTDRYIHLIQSGFFVSAATSVIKQFMSKEIKERMITHDGKNFSKLQDMIGYENLPAEYGGPKDNALDNHENLALELVEKNWSYLQKLQGYKKVTT